MCFARRPWVALSSHISTLCKGGGNAMRRLLKHNATRMHCMAFLCRRWMWAMKKTSDARWPSLFFPPVFTSVKIQGLINNETPEFYSLISPGVLSPCVFPDLLSVSLLWFLSHFCVYVPSLYSPRLNCFVLCLVLYLCMSVDTLLIDSTWTLSAWAIF